MAAASIYAAVRAQIEDGDLLLFRRPGSVLATDTLGDHSHAAKAMWRGNVLALGESREGYGARVVTLSSQVKRNPGVIDVFRPKTGKLLRSAAADLMFRHAGHEYDYRGLIRYAVHRAVIVNLLFQRLKLIKNPSRYPEPTFEQKKFCSCQVIWCYRRAAEKYHADFDPVPGLPSQFVTPNDLRHSSSFELVFPGLTI